MGDAGIAAFADVLTLTSAHPAIAALRARMLSRVAHIVEARFYRPPEKHLEPRGWRWHDDDAVLVEVCALVAEQCTVLTSLRVLQLVLPRMHAEGACALSEALQARASRLDEFARVAYEGKPACLVRKMMATLNPPSYRLECCCMGFPGERETLCCACRRLPGRIKSPLPVLPVLPRLESIWAYGAFAVDGEEGAGWAALHTASTERYVELEVASDLSDSDDSDSDDDVE